MVSIIKQGNYMRIILSFSKRYELKENFKIEVLSEKVLHVIINLLISEMYQFCYIVWSVTIVI